MKHTPGPWTYELQQLAIDFDDDGNATGYETKQDYYAIEGGNGYFDFDKRTGFYLTGYFNPKDAALISAAPEMLEALESSLNALEELNSITGDDWFTTTEIIKAAINKAKGL